MARDFDEMKLDDMTFVVAGETFTMVYVRPEVLVQWEDEEDGEAETAQRAVDRIDDRIVSFLDADDRARWAALRQREDNPVAFVQMREIVRWMVETQSHRPTETPSASADGRGATAATSTAKSRSREATPVG